jgi:hypothetical protein
MLAACGAPEPPAQPATEPVQEAPRAPPAPEALLEAPPVPVKMARRRMPPPPDVLFGSLVESNTPQLAECNHLARQANLAVTGWIVLRWTVKRGVARDIVTLTNTTGHTPLATCMAARISKWDFATVGDGIAQVSWDVDLAPPTQLAARVKLGTVEGPPKAEGVVKSNLGSLMFCHEQFLRSHPGVPGSLTARWTTQGARVADVRIDTHLEDELAACAVAKIRRWKLLGVPDGPMKATFAFDPRDLGVSQRVAISFFEPK